MNPKKLQLGLVVSYDLRPGNGEGLFCFRRFINYLSLTYLFTLTDLLACVPALNFVSAPPDGANI